MARRCLSLTCVSSLPSLSLCRLDPRRSPAPPLRVSFSHTWQQTAGGEACDPNMQGRALVTSVQRGSVEVLGEQASSINPWGPHSELPALQRQAEAPGDPYSIPCTRSRALVPLVPLSGGNLALAGLCAQPSPRAPRTRPPRCRPPLLRPRCARSPRIPLATLVRSLSLVSCPLLALELVPGTAVRRLQAPESPPRLRAIWRSRTPRPERALLPTTRPPAEAPALAHPLGTLRSRPRFSPREPRGCPEI